MNRSLVSPRSLWGSVDSFGGRGGLVFASAPWCAVGFSEGSSKLPVPSFVSGCHIASVASDHLGQGEQRNVLINNVCQTSIFLSYRATF